MKCLWNVGLLYLAPGIPTAVLVEMVSIASRIAAPCVIENRINNGACVIRRIIRRSIAGIDRREEECGCWRKEIDTSGKKLIYTFHGYQIGADHGHKGR